MARLRLLLGLNEFWLALSMLSEGLNTLLLPTLLLGALVQPVAGLMSDRQRAQLVRRPLMALEQRLIGVIPVGGQARARRA